MNENDVDVGLAGLLGAHDLEQWWQATFHPAERALVEARFAEAAADPLFARTTVERGRDDAATLLSGLAALTNRRGERHIALRLAEQAVAAAEATGQLPSLHIAYLQLLLVCRDRRGEDPAAHARAIEAGLRQVALAPSLAAMLGPPDRLPRHPGYQVLVGLLEEAGRIDEALQVATEALRAGWFGDWPRLIDRLRSRAAGANDEEPAAA